VDYDIVIIGGSSAGRYAALKAAAMRAKVALVEPQTISELLYLNALGEIAMRWHNLNNPSQFGLHLPCNTDKSKVNIEWETALLWTFSVESHVQQQDSPAFLAAQGIDIIVGSGHFQDKTQVSPLGFATSDRLLVGRNYLLASGSVLASPEIEGLSKIKFWTLETLWQPLNNAQPPQNWVIIGGTPQSIEVAQTLTRLGLNVTLIIEHPDIIAAIDPDIAQLLQAMLEAEGVDVLTKTSVTQVLEIDGKKWLQAGDKAIETDEIVVATKQQPNIESLNLAAVGVKWHKHRLLVNDRLQTTNPRIYACGDIIGGYSISNIANYEANIAVNNALFFATNKVNYQSVPWTIVTHPTFAIVGLSEVQAKRLYNSQQIIVLRQYFKSLASAQLQDETTGICKLIILKNGDIIGASILGKEAGELINFISLAISQKIKVNQLENISYIQPSYSEIFAQIARDWQLHKLNDNFRWEELLDDFFQFRRDWKI
jgi:pyruvate/2-oxoglutarate dehydrogenase complex dihydrolipoamide dehydrogenase (E3) component